MDSETAVQETNVYIQKVYFWMFLGLIVSGLTAYYVSINPALSDIIIGNSLIFFGLLIFQLLVVGGLVLFMERIPAFLGELTFLGYCFITGLTLSVIFLAYTLGSIGMVFFIAAAMFAFMSIYGYFTKTDLTSLGHILIMALFGLIIASVVNLFLHNSVADIIISIIGVIVFSGLAAYDTQKIKIMMLPGEEGSEEETKKEVMAALTLYLDFVNLFLDLLRLMGKRRS